MTMHQLSGHEASYLYSDTTHSNSNLSLLHIYDQSTAPGGKVRFKAILGHIAGRLDRAPLFRQKLQRVPLELDHPYWVEDEEFDLEYHVRHIALPKPGDWRQFCIQVSRIHARALDLHRPLWEVYVIEGLDSFLDLPEGSFSLMVKTHLAAVDVDPRARVPRRRTGFRRGRSRDARHHLARRPRHGKPFPRVEAREAQVLAPARKAANRRDHDLEPESRVEDRVRHRPRPRARGQPDPVISLEGEPERIHGILARRDHARGEVPRASERARGTGALEEDGPVASHDGDRRNHRPRGFPRGARGVPLDAPEGPSAARGAQRAPWATRRARRAQNELPQDWRQYLTKENLEKSMGADGIIQQVATAALGGVFSLLGVIAEFLLVPVFAYYFLLDWPNLLRRIDHMGSPRSTRRVRS